MLLQADSGLFKAEFIFCNDSGRTLLFRYSTVRIIILELLQYWIKYTMSVGYHYGPQ